MLGSFIGPFLVTLILTMVILLLQFVWKYVDDLMGKGIEWYIIIELLFYISVALIFMALPLAILLSSIMTFGNLGEKNELTALKASGLSLIKIMKPLTITMVFMSILAFLFSNYVYPYAQLHSKSLLYDITHKKPSFRIKDKVFDNSLENLTIRIDSRGKDGETLNKILLYDHSDSDNRRISGKSNRKIIAKTGKMTMTEDDNYMKFYLNHGRIYENDYPNKKINTSHPHRTYIYDSLVTTIDLSEFNLKRTDKELFKHHFDMMNSKQLINEYDTLKIEQAKSDSNNHKFFNDKLYISRVNNGLNLNFYDKSFKNRKDLDYQFSKLPKNKKIKIYTIALNNLRNTLQHSKFSLKEYENKFLKKKTDIKTELHKKISFSISCLILFFIGAPLGAITKKGGLGLPVILSVVIFLGYYIIGTSSKTMIENYTISPELGMWLNTIILTPLAIILTVAANNDISLLNKQGWKDIVKKIFINPFKK